MIEQLSKITSTYFKVKNLICFIATIIVLGIIINHFEPYPYFEMLFFVLILMIISMTLILKNGLEGLQEFRIKYYDCLNMEDDFGVLFSNKNYFWTKPLLFLLVLVYFIYLYQWDFLHINIMGIFILFLGGSTFAASLIMYEIYVRFIIALRNIARNTNFLKTQCNYNNPVQTQWLLHIHKLSQLLRNASLLTGVLFVLENSMIFVVNLAGTEPLTTNRIKFWGQKFDSMSIEFWIIWLLVFLSIGVAFPIMALLQTIYVKMIINNIQELFNERIYANQPMDLINKPCRLYIVLRIIDTVKVSLHETFLPQKIENIIALMASLLTCFIHIVTLFGLIS